MNIKPNSYCLEVAMKTVRSLQLIEREWLAATLGTISTDLESLAYAYAEALTDKLCGYDYDTF
jgi:hypothetical protein